MRVMRRLAPIKYGGDGGEPRLKDIWQHGKVRRKKHFTVRNKTEQDKLRKEERRRYSTKAPIHGKMGAMKKITSGSAEKVKEQDLEKKRTL